MNETIEIFVYLYQTKNKTIQSTKIIGQKIATQQPYKTRHWLLFPRQFYYIKNNKFGVVF